MIAGMWNHGAMMEAQATERRVAWPELSGAELGDIAAYFATLSRTLRAASGKVEISSLASSASE